MFQLVRSYREEEVKRAILANSLTVKVGDLVIPVGTDASFTNATGSIAGDYYPVGLVVGFSRVNGEVIGTGSDPLNTPASLTTASDNLTNAKYYVNYIPLKADMVLIGTLDAVAGTTSLSDIAFSWFNLADARTIHESDSTAYATGAATPKQIMSLGLYEGDATNFTIYCRVAKTGFNISHA